MSITRTVDAEWCLVLWDESADVVGGYLRLMFPNDPPDHIKALILLSLQAGFVAGAKAAARDLLGKDAVK